MRTWLPFVAAAALAACGSPNLNDKPSAEENPLFDAEKDDSLRKPTDHGPIAFDKAETAAFDANAQYHAWTFALTGAATVSVKTSFGGRGTPDTVAYLYRRAANGSWGSAIAKNDDADASTRWSSITKALGAGEYRVIVKGYTAREVGRFALTVGCAGAGCAPSTPAACLFGATFGDVLGGAGAVRVTNRNTFTAASASTLTALQGAQIVRALHASTHTDVTTVDEAFRAADGGEINLVWIWDQAGARSFVAVEYGAGDNSYGAIFPQDSAEPVALIQDGDLNQCTVKAETCLLGNTYYDLRTSDAFVVEAKVLTASSPLTTLERSQLLAAVRESYAQVQTVAEAFRTVGDGGRINQLQLTDRATSKKLTSYEYSAGDNSYGAIFTAGTTSRAAAIRDGDLYACAVFR